MAAGLHDGGMWRQRIREDDRHLEQVGDWRGLQRDSIRKVFHGL